MSTRTHKKGSAALKAEHAPPHPSWGSAGSHRLRRTSLSPPGRKILGLSRTALIAAAIGAVAVVVLGAIFVLSNVSSSAKSKYPYQVGRPGPGAQAPEIDLPSTAGGTFDLASLRGKTVLLFFEEGLTCEPCWTQIKDVQAQWGQFQAVGIDQFAAITTDPLPDIKTKVADEQISLPVLSDTDPYMRVSQLYGADKYTMMPAMPAMNGMGAMAARDGHSFVLVGTDGTILWRGDYGGAPNYTMYLPVPQLLSDIRTGVAGASK